MCRCFSTCFWLNEIEYPQLVRDGESVILGTDREGNVLHNRINVYAEMLICICLRYPGIPDPRTLTLDEIDFFYEGIRGQLESDTKPVRRGRR
jgi:hypothetical protein